MFLRSFGLKVRIQSTMDAENLGTVRDFLPQDDGQTGQTEFFCIEIYVSICFGHPLI